MHCAGVKCTALIYAQNARMCLQFSLQCIIPLPLRHPGGKSQTAGGRGPGQLHSWEGEGEEGK